jgi:hypothetical protein
LGRETQEVGRTKGALFLEAWKQGTIEQKRTLKKHGTAERTMILKQRRDNVLHYTNKKIISKDSGRC